MADKMNFPVALAMIQPEPAPGSYKNNGQSIDEIIEASKAEVKMLKENGFDGYIIQNRNDAPIQQIANPETISYMTKLAVELKREYPDMIQGILINWDGVASLAVADAANSDFIRVEHTYTGCEVGYAGLMKAQCVDILNFKKRIGSKVPIYADVQEIHYEQLCGKSIVDNAWDTVMNAFADGLFVGGHSAEESIEIIKAVRKKIGNGIPIFLSSGATGENIDKILQYFDGVSVGTWVKNGNMRNPIDPERAKIFMEGVHRARKLRGNND
ncbi:BtpA/SgcQ family protein [Clostridium polynesiense]|uniref:BtpA/SgcQ family protein n=1 Tax=Clostridium polynesiense TaxID=1325933 RepID=UPI000B271696|nr:BtpA/SgcQ family protein [Clostridium polynesiense]